MKKRFTVDANFVAATFISQEFKVAAGFVAFFYF